LSKLHHVITDFIRNAPVSIILLEGFEYLMVRNSFLTALKFVQSIMDEVVLHQSHLILSINPDAFSKAELALIRRELVELDVD
jgi:archaellum biogenesis ATPase FlaH